MGWYSINGIGVTLHGASRSIADEGRVEFTSWISVFWVPVVPIRSYSALYLGETPPTGITDEGLAFTDVIRIPHDARKLLKTFLGGTFALALCIGPIAYLIVRTDGRAATKLEMALILALCCLPVYLVSRMESRRKAALRGDNNAVNRSGEIGRF